MAKIGYARVSTEEQNEARQVKAFEEQGVDIILLDKMSDENSNRPQLKAMLEYVREGDVVVVTELARLARSTADMFKIVDKLTEKKVKLISLKENFDTNTSQGRFVLTIFSALAELEREIILERQKQGIAIAKAEGKYKGRQPIPFDEAKFRAECAKWRAKEQTAVETMKKMDMKPNRFYRRVKELGV